MLKAMKKNEIMHFSPNMLKTFELCPKKFFFRYIKNINMPVNDDIYEFGKNIHALASYYLRKEYIEKMEKSLSEKENEVWQYLKNSKYFGFKVVNTEYNLSFRLGDYFFGGRLDALVKNGENYYILDYKTGTAPKNAKYDFQTMVYILAVKEFFQTDKITFVYLDLKHKEEISVNYTKELDKEYRLKLNSIISKIEATDIYPKKQNCTCEYSLICY